jgi:hypothetical protein
MPYKEQRLIPGRKIKKTKTSATRAQYLQLKVDPVERYSKDGMEAKICSTVKLKEVMAT